VLKTIVVRGVAIFFVLLYPMLISIYVTLPLFIGYAGYTMIRGMERRVPAIVLFAFVYLCNLEVNLSLPLFLTLLATLVFYIFFYPQLAFLKRCRACVAVITVVSIDLLYLLMILSYDFIFSTSSVGIDSLLLFSLIMDILVAVLI
jgi:hypothetical protein